MSSFKSLIEDIKNNRKLANTEIPVDADPRTLVARKGKKRRAEEDLKELYLNYRKHVSENCVFILPQGKQGDGFSKLAGENFGCFSVEADALYKEIADRIDKRYYTDYGASPALFDIFMSIFNEICDTVGILGYRAVIFESKYTRRLNSKEDLLNLIREAFNDKVGAELIGIYAINKVAEQAIEAEYEGKTIPIIINTKLEDFSKLLSEDLKKITPNVFLTSAKKKPTSESVEKSLLTIRKGIK